MSIPTATSVPGAELVLRAARAGARPGHPGRGELRRPDQEHHRRAVADQRRAAQPGGRAAQRDHRLDPGRAGTRPRPGPPGARRAAGGGRRARGGRLGGRRTGPGVGRIGAAGLRRCWTAGTGPSTGSTSGRPRSTRRAPSRVPVRSRRAAGAGDRLVRPGPGRPAGAGRRRRRPRRDDRVVAGPDGLGRRGRWRRARTGAARPGRRPTGRRSRPGRGHRPAARRRSCRWPIPPRWTDWLRAGEAAVMDVDTSRRFLAGHVPGAAWALRTDLCRASLDRLGSRASRGWAARPAGADQRGRRCWPASPPPTWRSGAGDRRCWCWRAGPTGGPGRAGRWSPAARRDAVARRSTSTAAPTRAPTWIPRLMQAYLDWEYGLVEQLERDGTHGFTVLLR